MKGSGSRVVIGMSGGVDSSVAAALLVERGYEVIGVTMNLAGSTSRCCSLDDADDARRVAELLGIHFYVANYKDTFRAEVMEPFADSYLAGRTPIPCVLCNKRFKFHHLMERARALGADLVATGHYARIETGPDGSERKLLCAIDDKKDQSYFLYNLSQDQLNSILFPLGEFTKDEVRGLARDRRMATAEKPESQEICFVPDGKYSKVVERLRSEMLPGDGKIVDSQGQLLGSHHGIHNFTVGQRHGLGVQGSERRYVSKVDAVRNQIVVGPASELENSGAMVEDVSWTSSRPPQGSIRASIRIRHRHTPVPGTLEIRRSEVRVLFDQSVRAVTPGQAAVFYADEVVLGGGTIRAAL